MRHRIGLHRNGRIDYGYCYTGSQAVAIAKLLYHATRALVIVQDRITGGHWVTIGVWQTTVWCLPHRA